VALLHLQIIDRPREFPDEQAKLRYAFSHWDGTVLEQMIHLVDSKHLKLENFEAFVTSLEEAYGDPDCVNTAKCALNKLHQGIRDCVP
jgi:hypothetical protein